ncbi:pseudouridine synthase A [Candidatus Phytoplasma mali]|uniref:tRNA pseudouridine synthase A n=1 Tax=Phytoplasma mali (strain AT) TaxID=482235 RepID=TRUA_PHYMT|nr:tRNA pseudouridine(38-40) synthase TruA [Candidatus Phytoplasma mali]B3R022.1 RecName: Full=tRNA pseudouridine synthase A; AltName: Full=tRNA pseudouridine(38-40) synthase; AltName: Full=tRNA pseudouridylate synthase I; AltName: Full=tRNA-uridine isomerase I [Candidatus Phytoplasma mali AT]CAP18559.1 pseudouridine synthase A [Candidatus Phytoplasma mali]
MKDFNYKLVLSYDGTNYYGFQKQLHLNTIQSVLENVLNKITKQKKIKIYGASRTDKGVHASGQVVHFQLPFLIPNDHFQKILNFCLPSDIQITKIILISKEFHCRFQAKSKIYHYVFSKKKLNVFNYRFQVYIPNMDFNKIKEAILFIEGKHDFSLFTSQKSLKNYQRIIFKAFIKETKQKYFLIIHGNSFIQHMIRFLVGFLIEIAQNKKTLSEFKQMLDLKINQKARLLAPAKGLILKKIFY